MSRRDLLSIGRGLLGCATSCTFALAFTSCAPDDKTGSQNRLAVTERDCRIPAVAIVVSPDLTVVPSESCRIAKIAWDALGRARPESGLQPGDTSVVSSAYVGTMTIVDSAARSQRQYWTVSLSLRERPYDAEVHIDRSSSEASVWRTHKPIR